MSNATESTPLVLTEIQSGDGLALAAAGRLFPGHRGRETVDPSTVFRWVTKGAKTVGGQFVKLEAVRVGSRWLTSRAAIARFVNALTPAGDRVLPLPHVPNERDDKKQLERARIASEKLKANGA